VKLLVGLGNPGPPYAGTRHNAGAAILEHFARQHRLSVRESRFEGRFGTGRVAGEDVALLLPETYMNRSGDAVAGAVRGLGIAEPARDLLVIFDDVDLPFAHIRMRRSGGAGGHRGVADVIARLESRDFARLRFGVGRPPGDVATTDYVLSTFQPDERARLPAALEAAAHAAEAFVGLGIDMAMDRTNRLTSSAAEEPAAPTDAENEPPE
jgi:PTH1 family peptidyl-tRNA hydrolase